MRMPITFPTLPSGLQGKALGTRLPRSYFPPRRHRGITLGTKVLESFFPKIGIHRCLLCYLKLPHWGTRPNLDILFVVNWKTLPSQHLAKVSLRGNRTVGVRRTLLLRAPLPQKWGPATSRVGVYKSFTSLSEIERKFFVSVGILEKGG